MNIRAYCQHKPVLANKVYVDPTAVVIGQVSIAEHSSIWPMAVLRGDINAITIGSKTNVQDGAILHVTHVSSYNPTGFPLQIGEEVTIGHQAVLHGCTIGSRCLVGIGAKVLDGAVIEDEVLLGAGSLVPPGKTLISGYLWLGSPAKKIRPLTAQEKQFFSYSAAHYAKLAQTYSLST